MVESLHCTNCGAPLALQPGQTLVACGYCNSTLRVAPGGSVQPAVSRMAEVPPEVVDEVKRLLVLGQTLKAVAYYAKETGLTEAEATQAVQSLRATLGYAPPLNGVGLLLLLLHTLIGAVGLAVGIQQIAAGRTVLGGLLILAGVGWAAFNWFALGRGLRGFWLLQRGTPAEAVIVKRWTIKSIKAAGEAKPVELVRFLLDVRPAGRAAFEAEANGFVRERSRDRFQPGCPVRLRFDPVNVRKVVLIGPAD